MSNTLSQYAKRGFSYHNTACSAWVLFVAAFLSRLRFVRGFIFGPELNVNVASNANVSCVSLLESHWKAMRERETGFYGFANTLHMFLEH